MRTLGIPQLGVFTKRPETLTNDFFVNLLDMSTAVAEVPRCASTSSKDGTARRVRSNGLALESISCLVRTRNFEPSRKSMPVTTRKQKFVNDFVAVWNKVMNLDRFDLLSISAR